MSNNNIISIYFKLVRTSNYKNYNVNFNWTTEEFIRIMREKVIRDFNLENVEFIDTENNYHITRIASEDAPAIQPSTIKLIDKYGDKMHQIAFYIRPIPRELELETNTITTITNNLCSVCLTNEINIVFQPCSHLCVCNSCSSNPIMQTCPLCRSEITDRILVFV
uniref:RING-type domain-containing protein n=1 Tax=viral metagenome TaxID=1070528 RepID=A0A6C0D9G4_9ZZZZ